jgi:hypothetical protein
VDAIVPSASHFLQIPRSYPHFFGAYAATALANGAHSDAAPESKRFRRTAMEISGMLMEN